MDLMLTSVSPCGDVGMVHFTCEKAMNFGGPEGALVWLESCPPNLYVEGLALG